MIDALYISENALRANQEWISKISHNVANINTPGYKRTDVQFMDMVASRGAVSGETVSAGLGSKIQADRTDFQVGQLRQTGRDLDVAIDGPGFIEVVQKNGDAAYTTFGALTVTSDGRLSLADGTPLASDIYVPSNATSVLIENGGAVKAVLDNGANVIDVGQLSLARFSSPQALTPIGQSMFIASEGSGDPVVHLPGEDGTGRVLQGYIELSNVDLVDEMSNIMLAQRSYQINARLLQVTDQVMETVNNLRR